MASIVSDWKSVHQICSHGMLTDVDEITYVLTNTNEQHNKTIVVKLDNNSIKEYKWPSVLAKSITNESLDINIAGCWDENGNLYQPESSYLNEIYLRSDVEEYYVTSYFISNKLDSDLNKIQSRVVESLNSFSSDYTSADNYISLQMPDGSFSDIDYPPQDGMIENSYVGDLSKHFSRLESIAWMYHLNPEDKYKIAIIKGIGFYLSKNFLGAENWWQFNIGFPKKLANCVIFISGETTSYETKLVTDYIYSVSGVDSNMNNNGGANSIDYAYIQFVTSVFGLLSTNFPDDYSKHSSKIFASIEKCNELSNTVTLPTPGILDDYSYADHNNSDPVRGQLNLSYGQVYLDGLTNILSFANDTKYALDTYAIDSLGDHLINGYGWMCYLGRMALDSMGRSISRSTPSAKTVSIQRLIDAGYSNNVALEELKSRIYNQNESENSYFIGYRQFPLVDYASSIQNDHSITLRMISTRTEGNESGNGEGLKSYYLGNGTVFCTASGDEYFNIAPVWDWERLPGTTTQLGLYGTNTEFPLIDWGNGAHGSDLFVGTVLNSALSLSSMTLSKENMADSYKSYLMSPTHLSCFGSSIRMEQTNDVATTNVDQLIWDRSKIVIQKLDGSEVYIQSVGQEYEGRDIAAISMGTRRYCFPLASQLVRVSLAEQFGSWKEINESQSAEEIAESILSISITHDVFDYYHYVVYPHFTSASVGESVRLERDHHVVKFSENIFAVSNRGQESVPLQLTEELQVTIDTQGLVIGELGADGSIELSIADPTQRLPEVSLSVGGEFAGEYASYDPIEHTTFVNVPNSAFDISGNSFTLRLNRL